MKLNKLLKNVKCEKINYKNVDVNFLCHNSNDVKKNSLFFCLTNGNTDGHFFAKSAVDGGATVIVCEKKQTINCTQIIVENTRVAMAIIASNFNNNSIEKLKIITVVGTNGKSTTAYFVWQMLQLLGKNAGLIGTSGVFFAGKKYNSTLTTPDPLILHKLFNDMANKSVEYVVIEASAHAIFYNKLYGIKTVCTIFTNFSQDHLDFFKTMENYRQTKLNYFKQNNMSFAVINADDNFSKDILIKKYTYGKNIKVDLSFKIIKSDLMGTKFQFVFEKKKYIVSAKILCDYNIYNLMGAMLCLIKLGFSIEKILNIIIKLKNFEGRFEIITYKKRCVIIDYAHTPESLNQFLKSVKKISDKKLICVFGCPGNRDETKRAIMGKIVSNYCDNIILTADNPRFENSLIICHQIATKINKTYQIIDDRISAIKKAISMLNNSNIVLLVGKGSERYQDIDGYHFFHNDKYFAKKFLKEYNK